MYDTYGTLPSESSSQFSWNTLEACNTQKLNPQYLAQVQELSCPYSFINQTSFYISSTITTKQSCPNTSKHVTQEVGALSGVLMTRNFSVARSKATIFSGLCPSSATSQCKAPFENTESEHIDHSLFGH